jgi:hypothetical protein
MSFREWAAVGRRLSRVSSATTWALGDWLLFGERAFGQRYRTAIAATNLDYQTLRNYAWVAGRFGVSRRRPELSFQHHAELASLTEAEQDLWLQRAVNGSWSRNELRRQLKRRRSGATSPATLSLVVRVELTPDDERRWRQAANNTQLGLMDWLRTVANAAAEAALQPEPGAPAAATSH